MSKSKLDDRLEDRIVKFTDYAIDKYQFNFDNFKGKSVGVKLIDCGIKGLKLFQQINLDFYWDKTRYT